MLNVKKLLCSFFLASIGYAQTDKCFERSRFSYGRIVGTPVSDLDIIKAALEADNITPDIRVSNIRTCTNALNIITGLQVTVTDRDSGVTLPLNAFGSVRSVNGVKCNDRSFKDGEYLKTL